MSWRDSFDVLVGDGRGQYQKDGLIRAMEAGIAYYERYRDLYGFKLPLFADVGTGKTPSTLRYLHALRAYLREVEHPAAEKPVLIVCPASVKYNWMAETRRWRKDLSPIDLWVIGGGKDDRNKQIEFLELLKPKITIVNYDLVRILDHQQQFQYLTPRGKEHDPFFLAIVCDEVHAIKWRKAQRTRAVQSIVAHVHIGLTGTGMSNKPDSLWNVVTWIDNPDTRWRNIKRKPARPKKNCPLGADGMKRFKLAMRGCETCRNWMPRAQRCRQYGSKVKSKCWTNPVEERTMRYRDKSRTWGREWDFKAKYCELETNFFGTSVKGAKQHMMPHLNDRLQSWGMIRWRRAEVLDLNTLIYERVTLQPTAQQSSIYNQLRDGFISVYDDSTNALSPREIRGILAQLTYFRRSTTLTPREFTLALAGKNPEFAPDLKIPVSDKGAKQEWLVQFMSSELEQANGSGVKFLIFSDWTSALKPLINRLAKSIGLSQLKWKKGAGLIPDGNKPQHIAMIDGSTPKEARQEISERWNERDDFICICGSPAAYEGINLQGGLDSNGVVYATVMNLPWLPSQVVQMLGRAQRYGQDAQVIAMFPTIDGTIDLNMAKTLMAKQKAFDSAIDGDTHNMAPLFDVTSGRDALDLIGGRIG